MAVGQLSVRRSCEQLEKTCSQCGIKFKGRTESVVCSRRCAGILSRKGIVAKTLTCKQCGKGFTRHRKGGGSRCVFCSKACEKAFRSERKAKRLAFEDEQIRLLWQRREREREERKLEVLTLRMRYCDICGLEFETRTEGRNKTCSERCFTISYKKMKARARRLRRARKKGVGCEKYDSDDIFKRDKWMCWLCGEKTDATKPAPHPDSPTIDHVIPLSKGGPDSPTNVHCAHFSCNVNKSDIVVSLW